MHRNRKEVNRGEGEKQRAGRVGIINSYKGMFWEWCDAYYYDYDGDFTSVRKCQKLIRFYTLITLVCHISIISQSMF